MTDQAAAAPGVLVGFASVFGLIIGSFLNVVMCRVPAGASLLTPSSCLRCGARIRPWHNVPVLSWLLLRGRCASCRVRISLRYPLVEAGTGLAFAAVTGWWLPQSHTPASMVMLFGYLSLIAASIALAIIDIATQRLPDVIVFTTLALLILCLITVTVVAGDPVPLVRSLLGALVLCGGYGVLWYFGGMGFGDVKLAALLGMALGWFGWGVLVVGTFTAFFLGGITGVLLVLTGRVGRKSRIPFGPWMLLGAWVGLFLGAPITNWYLTTFLPPEG